MDHYDRTFETRAVIPPLCRGLMVKDRDAVSRTASSGGGNCACDAEAPHPSVGGAKVPWPCLNAGDKVP